MERDQSKIAQNTIYNNPKMKEVKFQLYKFKKQDLNLSNFFVWAGQGVLVFVAELPQSENIAFIMGLGKKLKFRCLGSVDNILV